MKNILRVLLLISVFGLPVRATPLDDKIKAFDDALKTSKPAGYSDPMFAERMTQQLGALQEMPGQEQQLEAAIHQVMATDPSKDVQEAGEALIEELQAQKKARIDALTSKVDAALASVPAAVAKAEKPADLDAVLDDLLRVTPANGNAYGYDPETQTQNARVTTTYQFVAQWQDYLSYRESGNDQMALNTLRNLLNQRPGGEPIIPRSEILARIAPLEARTQLANVPRPYVPPPPTDFTPILESVKTLDDLNLAVHQAGITPNSQTYDSGELAQLAFLYAQAKNGLPVSLDINPGWSAGSAHPDLSRIESMLLLYLLPRLLGPGAPTPNANEQVNDYLIRTLTTAETSQNWELVQRVLDAQMKIAKVQPQVFQGHQLFLAGLNQEIAQQYATAVTDYETALGSPDAYTSAKFIGDRLAAIKKDHPSDYDAGMKTFLHPPALNYPPGLMNPYVMAMRYGMPGYPPSAPVSAPASSAPVFPAVKTPPPKVSTPAPSTNAPTATPPATTK